MSDSQIVDLSVAAIINVSRSACHVQTCHHGND